jgi:hypothetical protein
LNVATTTAHPVFLARKSIAEKITLFFLFFFVPSPDLLVDCGSQETAGRKLSFWWFPTTVFLGARQAGVALAIH